MVFHYYHKAHSSNRLVRRCPGCVDTPIKKMEFHDPVLWAWLEIVFTPKRYKDPVLWAWLEIVFTPKRYQDPVL